MSLASRKLLVDAKQRIGLMELAFEQLPQIFTIFWKESRCRRSPAVILGGYKGLL